MRHSSMLARQDGIFSFARRAVIVYLSFILLLDSGLSAPTVSWHAYDPELVKSLPTKKSCRKYENTSRELAPEEMTKAGLWPGLLSAEALTNGETLFGLREATEIIWKHQNPEDCSKAKFLIVQCFKSGFGSTVHVEASLIALALKLGRVYLRYPEMCEHKWIVNNEHCRKQGKSDLECYYEPMSKCTFNDALRTDSGQMLTVKTIQQISYHTVSYRNGTRVDGGVKTNFEKQIYQGAVGHRSVIINHPQDLHGRNFIIPDQFRDILNCLPMVRTKWYYWWRAVSATYFLRPNKPTLKFLDKFRTLPIKAEDNRTMTIPKRNNGQCIAIYIRRADKGKEMKLLPFSRYAEAVELLMADGYMKKEKKGRGAGGEGFQSENDGEDNENPEDLGSVGKPVIFIGTEDVSVLKEAMEWGEKEGYQVIYTDLIDRAKLGAATGYRNYDPVSHPLEYTSMLLNIEYAVKCDAFIGTLMSNWCRMIDELRATIGGGANRPYIDLSDETCGKRMCVNGGVRDFQW